MLKFPLKFEGKAECTYGISVPWITKINSQPSINIALPVEFNGPGNAYTPEDLLGLAVLNCIIATFKVFCEKHKQFFENLEGKIIVNLDKMHETNGLHISSFDISLHIKGASDKNKIEELLHKSLDHCPVSNSVKGAKTFHVSFS
ncbi:MAG: OsmC family protein [Chlamydiae bacterium]|nr:OsmC family protein [Chlamydiota bacterium]